LASPRRIFGFDFCPCRHLPFGDTRINRVLGNLRPSTLLGPFVRPCIGLLHYPTGGIVAKFFTRSHYGLGMLVGGIVLSIWTQPWSFSGTWDGETWLAFGYIVIFGTVLAFYFFLTSVSKIGATFASLLCSVEPLAATLTAVLWLGVSFSGYDWAGTILILSTVALLTLSKEKAKK
jgi:drug/metabolite transporter (DMT)-like permease